MLAPGASIKFMTEKLYTYSKGSVEARLEGQKSSQIVFST